MDLSRRRMLQGVVGVTVAAATPIRWLGAAHAAPAGAGGWFSKASYAGLVGSTFFVTTPSGTASLTLTAVENLDPPSPKQRSAPADGRFSLLFTSASSFVQGTYLVRHSALGSANLFMVPVSGTAATPQRYELIVNRLT
jgi:hypothetical protein